MLKNILYTVAVISCLCVSSFLTWNSSYIWTNVLWHGFFYLAILLIIIQGIDSYLTNRKLKSVQTNLSNINKYGDVAQLNFKGDRSISDDYSLPSELSGWTNGFVKDLNGKKHIRYDDSAIVHYQQILKDHPRYPFSYYLMAEAYRLRNDPKWKEYAREAIKIFKITTSLPLHAPNHDEALKTLKELIAN